MSEDVSSRIYLIIISVASVFNVEASDLLISKRGKRELTDARHTAMVLITKKDMGISLDYIGSFFNGKNHTQVIYARKNIDLLLSHNRGFKYIFELCENSTRDI